MGRLQKRTVDYFSHDADASGSRTLTILENHFGAEGYAAWFKLLEIISATDNHFIDLRQQVDLEYLAGKMRLKPERLQEILNKLAERDAIDQELWKHGIIWCQNFVDRLSGVYEKRKITLPTKPIYSADKPITATEKPFLPTETTPQPAYPQQPDADMQQSKVNKSKGNKSKSKKTTPLPPIPTPEIPSSSSTESENDDRNIYQIFEQEIGELTPGISQILKDAEEEYTAPWVADAIKIAVSNNKRSWSYIAAVLRKCKQEGHPPSESRKVKTEDPDKYVKGKYGHVVRRS